MEERTKQRLVGGLVFVGALFIVLPFLFHNARPSLVDKVDEGNAPLAQQQPAALPGKPAPLLADNSNQMQSSGMQTAPDQSVQQQSPQPVSNDDAIGAVSSNNPNNTPNNISNNASPSTPTTPAAPADSVNPQPITDPNNPSNTTVTPATPAPASQNPTVMPSIMPGTQPSPTAAPAQNNATAATDAMPAQPVTATVPPVDAAAPQPSAVPPSQNQSQVQHGMTPSVPNTTVASVAKPIAPKHTVVGSSVKPAKLAMHDTITEGWTIQVGAFSERKNAAHVVAQLKEHHFHVYEKQLVRNGAHPLIAVYVGPERNLDHIRLAQEHLRSELNMNGEIKKYEAHAFS